MVTKVLRWGMILALIASSLSVIAAQDDQSALGTAETAILQLINARRLPENLVHLVPNATLNDVARAFVDDLSARPIDSLGEVFLTSDGRNIDDLLTEVNFTPYLNGYFVDFIPIIVRDFGPNEIVEFWINDFRSPDSQLRTRRNVRFNEPGLPIFSPLYREIGIAYEFNEATERHFYVIVFAAEPNVLPVIVAERGQVARIADVVEEQEVILYIHDERINRFGAGETVIGAIERMFISEMGGELDCNDPDNPEWLPYEIEFLWMLTSGSGTKTINVQLCDDFGRSVISTTQVEFIDPSTLPDIAGAVRATQTAAAAATNFAPFLPTVEQALTATAEAPR